MRFFSLVTAAAMSSIGCKTTQALDGRGRFVEDGVTLDAKDDWGGEPIAIDNTGVTATGGLSVAADGERTKIGAIARLLALRDTLDKPGADDAIVKAKGTFLITTSTAEPKATTVVCGAVAGTGEDSAGCDALDITVPAGKPEMPLTLQARSGNGKVGISLAPAAVKGLDLTASNGSIDVAVPSNAGAVISIVAATGDDVVLRLPRDFAADSITLETTGAIDTLAFPDVQSGKGRGAAGAGAKSIAVRSSRGRISLVAQ